MNNPRKIKFIFLAPYRFKKFDIDRYEIKFFKKKFNIEIHDFSKLLYPHFNSSFKQNYAADKEIKIFKSFEKWKNHIHKIKKSNYKIFALNLLAIDSYKAFKILFFIKSMNIKRMDFLNFGIPYYSHEKNLISVFEHYKLKFRELIYRTRFLIGNLKSKINQYFFNNIISIFFNIKPDYLFTAGKKFLNDKKKKCIIVKGNSWDYSRYVRELKKNKKNIKINSDYAVFLANSGPKYPTDSHLYKTKVTESVKNWYGGLNRFFNNLENKFDLKVIIATHPKAKFEKKIPYLGNRRAYKNSAMELVKNCKYVITHQSTSLSYATIYKKPIFFIYTNETKKNPGVFKYNKFLSKLLVGKLINMNNYSKNNINHFKINNLKTKYNNYIKNYLTSRLDKKANFEIITSLIKN